MKSKFALILGTTLLTLQAYGVTTEQLKLDCNATYSVLESTNYYIPAHYRVPDIKGTYEVLKVIKVFGKDCEKLTKYYGLEIKEDQIIKFPIPNSSNVIIVGPNLDRLDKIFTEKVQQSFSYQTQDGNLPLFPQIHKEHVTFLGLNGAADSKKLYGTPDFSAITDHAKLKLVKTISSYINYGKELGKSYLPYYMQNFFELLLDINVSGKENNEELATDLLLLFQNGAKFATPVTTGSPLTLLGHKIHQTLNISQGTKWQSTIEIYQKNPLLFADQIITWALSDTSKAPKLNAAEIEAYLQFAYDTSVNLKAVPQVSEARYLLNQYKGSANSLFSHSSHNEVNVAGPKYDLTAHALDLIEKIIEL